MNIENTLFIVNFIIILLYHWVSNYLETATATVTPSIAIFL